MSKKKEKIILLTGSSGFIGTYLKTCLNFDFKVFTLDKDNNDKTGLKINLSDKKNISIVNRFIKKNKINTIIHLAASRNDYNSHFSEYYENNVDATKNLLESISINLEYFLHVGSVAEIDGKSLDNSKKFNSDNSYRYTKYLQSRLIENFCTEHKIQFSILCPSAIFNNDLRNDTNIGRLQKIVKLFPFFPKIKTLKSLTFLPNFCKFISTATKNNLSGKYICIDRPILSVSEIVSHIAKPKKVFFLNIPGLYYFLILISLFFFPLKFIRIDPMLTFNRVIKLFRNTSYEITENYDQEYYQNEKTVDKILEEI